MYFSLYRELAKVSFYQASVRQLIDTARHLCMQIAGGLMDDQFDQADSQPEQRQPGSDAAHRR